jgi:tetratricopeptide (TPR) repeat protein
MRAVFERLRRWLGAEVPAPAEAPAPVGSADLAQARYRAGLTGLQAGDFALAEQALREAVEMRHDHADAHYALGVAYEKQGRVEDARDCYLLATCFGAAPAKAHFRLGVLSSGEGRPDEALEHFQQALRCQPDDAEVHNYMGKVWLDKGRPEEAEACFRRALDADPGHAMAHSNLGLLLFEVHYRVEEALSHLERALERDPKLVNAYCNYTAVLQHLGRCNEALDWAARGLALEPGHAQLRVNRALALLMQGDFEQGWVEYEARLESYECFKFRQFPQPRWTGEDAAGKRLLIYAEQGIGDEIMFASCLPELLRRAGHCVIDCHPKLEALFRRSFPEATIHGGLQTDPDLSWLARMPAVDARIAIGSLPRLYRSHVDRFPGHGGYLAADPGHVAAWRQRLDALGEGLKVGVSWRGGTRHSNQRYRSMPLTELAAPLAALPAIQLVNLQYTDCSDEIKSARADGIVLHHWPEAIADYDQTAALVCALDLVVSVQTAIVHLAGALGRPVWVMVPAAPEWRYQRAGHGMPWYPSVRIFRQSRLGEWRPVIDAVVAALGCFR